MRYYDRRKATAEESCRLKMSYLRKRGLLSGEETAIATSWKSSQTGKETKVGIVADIIDGPYVTLIYTLTDRNGNKADYAYQVQLVTTPCNFGGERYWFSCPYCRRRIAVLYLAPGSVKFMCRHCNNLSYHSRNETNIHGILGITEREIKRLHSEIKRWTWRGRPTRKVRRLHALERKMGMLLGPIMMHMERLRAGMR